MRTRAEILEEESRYTRGIRSDLFDKVDGIHTDVDTCNSEFAKNMFRIVNRAENMFSGGQINSTELAGINNKMDSLSKQFGEKCTCRPTSFNILDINFEHMWDEDIKKLYDSLPLGSESREQMHPIMRERYLSID